jgi:photosystem II stability/assembly factor-like uncharacterized protein
MHSSRDGGTSWKRVGGRVGLLAWPTHDRLYLVDPSGWVSTSANGGQTFTRKGRIGGQPAAILATSRDELYAALHDGTIKHSTDGGVLWTVRSTP